MDDRHEAGLVVGGLVTVMAAFGCIFWLLLPTEKTSSVLAYHWQIQEKHQKLRTDIERESTSHSLAAHEGEIIRSYEVTTYETVTQPDGTLSTVIDTDTYYVYHPWITEHSYETNDYKDGYDVRNANKPLPEDGRWRKRYVSKFTMKDGDHVEYELDRSDWDNYRSKYPKGTVVDLRISVFGVLLEVDIHESELTDESEFEEI